MIEIPEAVTLARQVNASLAGKGIQQVTAAASPHKFAWYYGDPADYPVRLTGETLLSARAVGGTLEQKTEHTTLTFSDGVNLRYLETGDALPQKHQLLLQFNDGSHLAASVQMYGGLVCWPDSVVYDNPYYLAAKSKIPPLSDDFDEPYFHRLLAPDAVQKLSLKAALATEQRIPGLGNGVLQDILWHARLSPRKKVNTLSESEEKTLFDSLKSTLAEMVRLGGRDTETDLYGNPGGYAVVMCAKNNAQPCPQCGAPIFKEAYMGGSVYYCRECQKD